MYTHNLSALYVLSASTAEFLIKTALDIFFKPRHHTSPRLIVEQVLGTTEYYDTMNFSATTIALTLMD